MGILKKLKSTWAGLNWFRKHWKSILVIGVFCIALMMMVTGSFTLAGAQLVTVLLIGCILILATFIKVLYDFLKEKIKGDLETDILKNEVARLKNTLQFERSGGIKVRIRPILEMALLEAECVVTKFFNIDFDENKNEIIKGELKEIGLESLEEQLMWRFLGGLTAKFRAKYGIDWKKVYVKRDEQLRTLFVAGAEATFLGIGEFPEMRWEGSVVLKPGFARDWVSSKDCLKLEAECKDRYMDALQKSLKNGPDQLNWVKGPLQRNIDRVLTILAQSYKVVRVERPAKGFIPLSQYLRSTGLSNGTDRLFLP